MTNEDAKKMLKAKLECLKRETSGTDAVCNNRLCDNCIYNYEQGNMGEQQEALEIAIKALEQRDKMFFISEILVRESKWEITPEKALNQIRDILMGYTFWDKESEDKE